MDKQPIMCRFTGDKLLTKVSLTTFAEKVRLAGFTLCRTDMRFRRSCVQGGTYVLCKTNRNP